MAVIGVGGLLAAIGCGVWALAPLDAIGVSAPDLQPTSMPQPTSEEQERPFDQRAFAIKLWRVPAKPVEVAQSAEPPKASNLQLIGIINENGVHRAAIYDVEADRLLILASGDHIGKYSITSVTPKSVELSDGRATQTLKLSQEPS